MGLAQIIQNIEPAPVATAPSSQHWFQSVSGRVVDYLWPHPGAICINDIAVSLSRLPRFLGHTQGDPIYSVAAHSLWVSNYVALAMEDPQLALYALMHDAHEAYTGDLPSPLKSLPHMQGYVELQARMQDAIYKAFDIPPPGPDVLAVIEQADRQALAVECVFLVAEGGADWPVDPIDNTARRLVNDVKSFIPASETCRAFIDSFALLMARVKGEG